MTQSINFDSLKNEPRLLIEARLKPVAGTRFQPTGFPDLGAATYRLPDSTEMLLVESAQSMANRLEHVCIDESTNEPISELKDLPYVESTLPDGSKTNSLMEAHRINSPYIVNSPEFEAIEKAIGFEKNKPFDRQKLVEALFKYDPNSLVHGIFLEKIGGVVRLPRSLSAFIEARNVQEAASGGVKLDRIQPETTGKVTPYGKAEDGYGNVPFHRSEFFGDISAFFILDLALIRAFKLPDSSKQLLIVLALFKIRRFLDLGLRLRTACDLELVELEVKRPASFDLPSAQALSTALSQLIEANKSQFAACPLSVKYDVKIGKAKKEKKDKEKKTQQAAADEAVDLSP